MTLFYYTFNSRPFHYYCRRQINTRCENTLQHDILHGNFKQLIFKQLLFLTIYCFVQSGILFSTLHFFKCSQELPMRLCGLPVVPTSHMQFLPSYVLLPREYYKDYTMGQEEGVVLCLVVSWYIAMVCIDHLCDSYYMNKSDMISH